MQLFTPQVQLFSELTAEGPEDYILHAVTFCDCTNFRADGHQIVNIEPDEHNKVTIHLFIREEEDLPKEYSLNPVVHTIKLGPIDFQGDGFIESHVFLQKAVISRTEGTSPPSGSTTSSTTSSKKKGRPIGEVEVPELF